MTTTKQSIIIGLAAALAALALVVAAAPAAADSSSSVPYHGPADVTCDGNSPWGGNRSSLTVTPQYHLQDSRRFEVWMRNWIVSDLDGRWRSAREYEDGWRTGRTLAPGPWVKMAGTGADQYGTTGAKTYWVDAAEHYLWTQYAFRVAGGEWQFSAWQETTSYRNREHTSWGSKASTANRCDTTPREQTMTFRPS